MRVRLRIALLLLLLVIAPTMAGAQQQGPTQIFLTSGTTWTPPTNWNNSHYLICAWGAGNNGAAGSASTEGGGGGASGDFACTDNTSGFTYSNGTPQTIQIGTSGGGVTTTGATFLGAATCAASNLCAAGGAAPSTITGGAAGNTANDVGTAKAAGCAGGSTSAAHGGGGGGGAPNTIASCAAGAAGAPLAGGNGGAGSEGPAIAPVGVGGTSTTNCTAGSRGQIDGATGAIPTTGIGSGAGGGGGATGSTHDSGCAGGANGAGGGGGGGTTGSPTVGPGAPGAILIRYWPVANGQNTPDISSTCAHTTATVTLPNSVTANHSILVGACLRASANSPVISSISCAHTGPCVLATAGANTTTYSVVGVCPYDTGGSETCTFNFTNSGTSCVHFFDAVEQPALNSIDASVGNTQSATTAPLSGNLTTTNGNDVLWGLSCTDNAGGILSGPPNQLINVGAVSSSGANDPAINNSTMCFGAGGTNFSCCTGAGTGNCQFSQTLVSGISLPSALATATWNMGQTNTQSANAATSFAGFQDVATVTATPSATPTLTATPSTTPTTTPTPSSTPTGGPTPTINLYSGCRKGPARFIPQICM